jgi:phospholipase/lecithinase/hemolysin
MNIFNTISRAAMLLALISPMSLVAMASDGKDPALVIFGDSLADGGNYFVNTGDYSLGPFELVPSAPYAIGGFHFSNGKTWVEQLANILGDNNSGKPALRHDGHFTNYAYGRARSRPAASTFPEFDLGTQVALFLSDYSGGPIPDSIYIMGTGSNDVRDALGALSIDPSGAISMGIIQAAITATADNMLALYGSGAKTFLVPNVPDLGMVPAVRMLGFPAQMAGTQLSVGYNVGLATALDSLEGLPGVQILRVDIFMLLHDLAADPEAAGFENIIDSCITPGTIVGAICERPHDYLFWDGAHPTRRGHRYLAEQIAAGLATE